MRLNKEDKYVLDQISGANGIDWEVIAKRCPMPGARLDDILDKLVSGHLLIRVLASYRNCQNEIYFPAGTSFEFKME